MKDFNKQNPYNPNQKREEQRPTQAPQSNPHQQKPTQAPQNWPKKKDR